MPFEHSGCRHVREPGVPVHAVEHASAPPSVSPGSQLAPIASTPETCRVYASGVVLELYASAAAMYVPAAGFWNVQRDACVDTPPSSSQARLGSLHAELMRESSVSTVVPSVSSVSDFVAGIVSV